MDISDILFAIFIFAVVETIFCTGSSSQTIRRSSSYDINQQDDTDTISDDIPNPPYPYQERDRHDVSYQVLEGSNYYADY